MKIDKIITSTVEQEVQFEGLTLLSKEEYIKYAESIPPVNFWWWLRSPGYYRHNAISVDYNGSIDDYEGVSNTDGSVRPTLIVKSSVIQIGDKFNFYGHTWTVISTHHALCNEEFCCMAFRKDGKAEGDNIYEASDIKKYLDAEWEKMKDGERKGDTHET